MPDTTPKTIFEAAVAMTAGATSNIAGGRLPGPIMADATIHRDSPLWEVAAERERQNVKWGEQNHPDGTGSPGHELHARLARYECKRRTAEGTVTWRDILDEEVAEAYAEDDPANLRAELIQVAAVACAWVEAIDRRTATPAASASAEPRPSYRAFLGENPCSDPACPCHPQPPGAPS